LSPLAGGLFQRAIMSSAAPNSGLVFHSRDVELEKTKKLANDLQCNHYGETKGDATSLTVDQLECIKNSPAEEIINLIVYPYLPNISTLVYGTELIPIRPTDALEQGLFNKE